MTAKELINNSSTNYEDLMIEFAKYHVEEALKQASEKVRMRCENYHGSWYVSKEEILDEYTTITVAKETVLNSYPLENIK